jgi:lipopolysaccharide assembly outer membrane protein LptD (OstA)
LTLVVLYDIRVIFHFLAISLSFVTMAASSSSLAATPPSEQSTHGIELADRKSAQFGTKEIFEQQQSDGSDDYEDATRSTNVDRYAMERMGKTC